MIIANGYIRFKLKTTPDVVIDPETGYPKKQETLSAWGEPIECQYTANRYNALGRVLGEPRTERSYEILIEYQAVQSEQLQLQTLDGDIMGEFSIISSTPLEAVGQLKLLV